MEDLRIVFMGTPQFAVTILDGIIKKGASIVAVITAPDRPAGRGRKITESAVKTFSRENGLNVLQPTNLKDDNFVLELSSLNADLFIVVAFRMLPEIVWAMPAKGTINLHASLLPNYRGAAPINWAIINGEIETGVTTFFIEKQIDTGKIIQSKRVNIHENMTAGELHDELAQLGSEVMSETIKSIYNYTTKAIDQDEITIENRKSAPKIYKNDCMIDWNSSSIDVHNFIRGLSPYPGAWCNIIFKDKKLTCKLFNSKSTNLKVNAKINWDEQSSFLFPCKDNFISISEIQIEGKKRVTYSEFSKGNSFFDLKVIR